MGGCDDPSDCGDPMGCSHLTGFGGPMRGGPIGCGDLMGCGGPMGRSGGYLVSARGRRVVHLAPMWRRHAERAL